MRDKENYWHALPREISQWWKQRSISQELSEISLHEGKIYISPQSNSQA
jgi:hypothetical protein